MPYNNVPRELWDKMDRCVADVRRQHGYSKERAIAICHAGLVKTEAVRPLNEVAVAAPTLNADGNLDGIIVVEGVSKNRNRYTRAALESAIPVFAHGLIYADHNLPGEPPERSIRNVVGRLPGPEGITVETTESGQAVLRFRGARLSESAGWLKTMLAEGILGDMSINAAGTGKQEGDEFIVEAFVTDYPASLDFVTRAAAGGYGALRESETSTVGRDMENTELQRLRAALKQARREAREAEAARLLEIKTRGLSESARLRVAQRVAGAIRRFVEQDEMPAVEVTLPEEVQALPEEAQALWLRAYMEAKPKGEFAANILAWAEVLKSYEQNEAGDWVKSSTAPNPSEELAGEIEQAAQAETAPEKPEKMESAGPGAIRGMGRSGARAVTEAEIQEIFKQLGGQHG